MGSHYRAAGRARSDAEFIAKLGTAIEEADETAFWLEVLVEAEVVRADVTKCLYGEADELTRIFVAARETTQAQNQGARLEPASWTDFVPDFTITVTYFLSCGRPHRCQFGEELIQVRPIKGPAERLRHGLVAMLKREQIVLQA